MSLRFMDGFDSYATADMTKKWSSVSATAINATAGRRGTGAMTASGTWNAVLILDNQPQWAIGCAFKMTAYPAAAVTILDIRDGTTSQVALQVLPSGLVQVVQGSTVLGTGGTTLSLNAFYALEFLAVIHATTGVVTVVVGGVTQVAVTNVDTQGTANAYANQIRIGPSASVGNAAYDDLYICDGTGSAPHNGLLGDCRVDTLLPNADGTAQQWTPSTGTTHYTLVDDATPNTTDYVSSATIGHRDIYGMQDLTAQTGTIYAVQLSLAALKSDAGARSITPLIVSGASEALGTATALSTSQTYTRHVQTTDPATGAAWTEAAINNAQCGAECA